MRAQYAPITTGDAPAVPLAELRAGRDDAAARATMGSHALDGMGPTGADPDGARLRMTLHYGGGLFQPVIERVLRDEIERSRQRLLALVTPPAGGAPTPSKR